MTDDAGRALARRNPSAAAITARLADRTLSERGARIDNQSDQPEAESPSDEFSERYDSSLIRIDSLGLQTIAIDDVTDDISPPNLVVVGGSAKEARGVAEQIERIRGGGIRQIELADLPPSDLAEIVTSLEKSDVLLITSLDRVRADTLSILEGLLELSPEDAEAPELGAGSCRVMYVLIGRGRTARSLRLTLPNFFLLVRTWSGKVPEPLRAWGAQVLLSLETKVCPRCAEEIKAAAAVCRYCGFALRSTEPGRELPLAPPGGTTAVRPSDPYQASGSRSLLSGSLSPSGSAIAARGLRREARHATIH